MSTIAEISECYLTYNSSAGVPMNNSEVGCCSSIEHICMSSSSNFMGFLLCEREINSVQSY